MEGLSEHAHYVYGPVCKRESTGGAEARSWMLVQCSQEKQRHLLGARGDVVVRVFGWGDRVRGKRVCLPSEVMVEGFGAYDAEKSDWGEHGEAV